MTMLFIGVVALVGLIVAGLAYAAVRSKTPGGRGASASLLGAIVGTIGVFFSPLGSRGRLGQVEFLLFISLWSSFTSAGVLVGLAATSLQRKSRNTTLTTLCGLIVGGSALALLGHAVARLFGYLVLDDYSIGLYGGKLVRQAQVIGAISGATAALSETFRRQRQRKRQELIVARMKDGSMKDEDNGEMERRDEEMR